MNRLFGFLVLVSIGCNTSGEASTGKVTIYGRLSDSVVRLPSGDSLEFQATGPAVVQSGPPGLLVTYRPFVPISDTARVRQVALGLFRTLEPRLASNAPFVALRAVDRSAAERRRVGLYDMHSFGVVIERRADGRWYPLDESTPVPER